MYWRVFVDGASLGNPGESGAGVVIFDSDGREITRYGLYLGTMTNNMAEYEALLSALRRASESSVKIISIFSDSELIVKQVNGQYKVKQAHLYEYYKKVRALTEHFDSFMLQHIPREENRIADKLAKDAAKKRADG